MADALSPSAARERIAFAADLPLREGLSLYGRLAPHVGAAKVGLSLFVEEGPAAVQAFRALGAKVFLDLKLHDIPNTVELAAERAARLQVAYLTVHASGGEAMLRAAVKGAAAGAAARGCAPPVVLAVTVLTSMDEATLRGLGVDRAPAEQARALAELALRSGAGGLVCSAHEAASLKAATGGRLFVCTPGIRPAGAALGDQARVASPAAAVRAGADLLVVGRPIADAADPVAAAAAIEAEVAGALAAEARAAGES